MDEELIKVLDEAVVTRFRDDKGKLHREIYTKPPFGDKELDLFESHRQRSECEDRFKAIRKAMGSVAGKNILDIGCATGYIGFRLLQCGADFVIGIDNKPSQLRVIDHFAKKHNLKFHTWCMEVPCILSPSEKHDIVLYLDLHQHIIQHKGLSSAIGFLRLLKEIGKVCYIAPSGQDNNGKMEMDFIDVGFKFECIYEGKAPYGRNIYKCW
tara:strand:- start:2400 stop:3032 length:633 start_codon:yes stop_codon:yes gene_type:complete